MNLPWFIFDLTNKQLITSSTVPTGSIGDEKNIIFAETPILGNNFSPLSSGSFGNRKISLQIPIVNRGYEGNIALINQFELLRNKAQGFLGLTKKSQWAGNPKVLYSWGVWSTPLEYFVTKCSMQHTVEMVNEVGLPQHTIVSLELTLDETSLLYKIEEIYRNVSAVLGAGTTALQGIRGYV